MADQHNDNIPALADQIVNDVPDIKENLEYHKDCFEKICTGWSNTVTTDLAVDVLAATVSRIVGAGTVNQGADVTVAIHRKIVEIGDWNMDSTATVNVAHGLTLAKIRRVDALIRNDADSAYYAIDFISNASGLGNGGIFVNGTNAVLTVTASGLFDSSTFDSTSYNRGWVILEYVD